MGLSNGHNAFDSLFDGNPESLLLDDLVGPVGSFCESELHRVPSSDYPYPGLGIEALGGLMGSAENLDRSVCELDHRVAMVP